MKGTLLIYTPGIPVPREIEALTDDMERLEQLRDAVGGDIEHVPGLTSTASGISCVAFCNEHGKNNNMPLNYDATQLWRAQFPDCGDYLVGPVVLLIGDAEFMESV